MTGCRSARSSGPPSAEWPKLIWWTSCERRGDSIIALVAVDRARIVGHAKPSNMAAPFKALGLGPVSVRPERSGVGSAPVGEALRQARQEGWGAVFVLGDPSFYRRFGFEPEPAARFTCPYVGPHFMVLFMNNDLPSSGTIDYAPAFAALRCPKCQ